VSQAIWGWQWGDCAMAAQPSTLQPSTFNLQPSTFNLQPSTFNLQPSTFNLQPSTGSSARYWLSTPFTRILIP
jgi:hypothetical protein